MGSTHYGLCYGMVCRDVGLRRGWHQPAFKGLLEDRPGELPLVSPKMRPFLRPLTPAGLKTKMPPYPEARL